MKKITIYFGILLLLLGCGETDYKISTKYFIDGSCERTMIAYVDSTSINDDLFSIEIDTTWKTDTTWVFDTTENEYQAELRAIKRYNSVKEMNDEFSSSQKIDDRFPIYAQVKKKFRWFYTYFHYKEVYPKLNSFSYYSVSDYFTDDEISAFLLQETDSIYYAEMDSIERKREEDRLDDKLTLYLIDNYFEEYILIVKDHLPEEYLPKFTEQESKEFIKTAFTESIIEDLMDGEDFRSTFDSIFHPFQLESIKEQDSIRFSELDENLFVDIDGDYTNYVQLPGKLLNTNANSIQNGELIWNIESKNEYLDYEMWAKTRIVNKWLWIVSGLIVLLSILLLVLPSRSK
jgi:hypothetical protein